MVKLIYGLAKFSNLKYGFGSKPKTLDKKKFLFNIKKFFHIFECADIYRESIDHVKFLKDKDVHFKISKLPIKKSEKIIENYFKNKIKYYNKSHSTKKIKVLYLHENSLRIINNYKVINVLKKLKKDKIVKNFGASIYSENELKFVINNNLYKYIQIPLNLADSYFFFEYKKKMHKKKIVARSLVLQGTLLNSVVKKNFQNQIKKYKEKIDNICNNYHISREELVYRFLFSLKRLDYAIIGSVDLKNIKNIIRFKKKGRLSNKIMKKLIYLSKQKKRWVNPRNWV